MDESELEARQTGTVSRLGPPSLMFLTNIYVLKFWEKGSSRKAQLVHLYYPLNLLEWLKPYHTTYGYKIK